MQIPMRIHSKYTSIKTHQSNAFYRVWKRSHVTMINLCISHMLFLFTCLPTRAYSTLSQLAVDDWLKASTACRLSPYVEVYLTIFFDILNLLRIFIVNLEYIFLLLFI